MEKRESESVREIREKERKETKRDTEKVTKRMPASALSGVVSQRDANESPV